MQQTVVVPIGKVEPEGWSQTIPGFGSHVSVAVTVKLTGFPLALVHWREKSGGHVIVGGVRSTTVTLKQHAE